MKNKMLHMAGMILNILIVIESIIFGIINFENITYDGVRGLIIPTDPTKSLHIRYKNLLEDKYGRYIGRDIYWKIVDNTVWIIEHRINELIFFIIISMMIGSMWINKKLNKKMNKVLRRYFIFCILLMLWTIFVSGPHYVRYIFE